MSFEQAANGAPLRPRLRAAFHIRWEAASLGGCLLVHPAGTVKLNASAGQILVRCDGTRELDDIIAELETLFLKSDIATDVYRFLDDARQRGWVD